ncbi:MAG: hypothetical protein JRG68_09615 [Deltaproteobacteria bacterium]|nr:hypothetical protein [Deltaproteobacteria bacterium]
MISCNHSKLELLPQKKDKLRCRHCHLTIGADELGDGCCPECFEIHGKKRYDFEEIDTGETGTARYRCEECGIIIETEGTNTYV